jgi:hypothetical protein
MADRSVTLSPIRVQPHDLAACAPVCPVLAGSVGVAHV